MTIHHYYLTNSLRDQLDNLSSKGANEQLVASLLDLVTLRTIARSLSPLQRDTALSLLRSQPERFVSWLDEAAPATRLAISESLMRSLLAIAVE